MNWNRFKFGFLCNEEGGEGGAGGGGGSDSEGAEGESNGENPFSSLMGQDGTFSEGWLDKLPDETYGEYKPTLSNVKSFDGMAKSLVDNMKAARERTEGMVKLPGEDATTEELAEFRKSMGLPTEAAEYDISRPEGMPEDVWHEGDANALGEALAKHGAPKELAGELLEIDALRQERAKQEAVDALRSDQQKIKAIYGDKLESKKYAVDQMLSEASSMFGIKGLSIEHEALTHPEIFQLLAEISGKLGGSKASGFSNISDIPASREERAQLIINDKAKGTADEQVAEAYHRGTGNSYNKAHETVMSLLSG